MVPTIIMVAHFSRVIRLYWGHCTGIVWDMLSSKSNCGMNTREVSDSPKFTRDEPRTSQLLWLKFMEIGHKQDCYIVWPNLPSAPMMPQISLLHFPDVVLSHLDTCCFRVLNEYSHNIRVFWSCNHPSRALGEAPPQWSLLQYFAHHGLPFTPVHLFWESCQDTDLSEKCE